MKDLVSQDYIDYQDGRDHFRYFGQPVDPLGKDSQNSHAKAPTQKPHAKLLNSTHENFVIANNLLGNDFQGVG